MLQDLDDATGIAAYTDFPPELLDQIFVYLHLPLGWDEGKDRGDLCACRLVNRMWADVAFRHTFAAISFTVGAPDVASADPKASGSLEDLQNFLTESPHICEVVHTLSLISVATYRQGDVRIPFLHSIVALLPRVRRILLSGMIQRLAGSLSGEHNTRLSVHCLQLSAGPSNYGADLGDLLNVIELFQDIDELAFQRFYLVYSEIHPRLHPPTRIRHIRYDKAYTRLHPVLTLVQCLNTQQLHSLTISTRRKWASPGCWAAFYRLLQSLGPQLTQLGLYVSGRPGEKPGEYR